MPLQSVEEGQPLSHREKESLLALARYGTYREAGESMGLSLGSMNVYIPRAFKKLGVNSRMDAFVKLGWIRWNLPRKKEWLSE